MFNRVDLCFTVKSKSKWHFQGIALFLLGIFLEFVYDDSHLDHVNEPWHQLTNYVIPPLSLFSSLISKDLRRVFNFIWKPFSYFIVIVLDWSFTAPPLCMA